MTAPDPRLNEIQDRLDAATPGPWAVDELGDVETVPEFDLHRFDIMPDTIARTELRKEDGAFIAAAPADVRYLLTELRTAHEALERVEALAGRAESHGNLYVFVDDITAAVAAAKGDEQ